MMELQDSKCYKELESIVANVTWANPVSDVLFMGKYQVFLLEKLALGQKPIGEYFKSAFVICAAKKKKLSEQEVTESFCDASYDGNPLIVKFEKLCPSSELSSFQQLSLVHDIYPLSSSIGRQLLFICSKVENKLKLPFIVICHGNRAGSLIMYGAGGKNNSFHMKLLNQGNISTLKNLPSIQGLKAFHMQGLPPSLTSESCIEKLVSAVYRFLDVKGVNLSVQSTWSITQAILEPLPAEGVCFAKLQIAVSDDESGAFLRYKELKLLKDLQQCLKTGLMTWISSSSLDNVLREIEELLNDVRSETNSREYPELPDNKDSLETVVANERLFLSLPDRLWLIMKNCSSFEDLIAAIQHSYKVFDESNIAVPLICSNDMSTISKDINLMFKKSVYCPKLDQKRAAELLLEIGVEKMRRDYYEYFISHGFITQDLFNHFTQPSLLSLEAVTCLEKLDLVLKLALICEKQLNLKRSILNDFIRNALICASSNAEDGLQREFRFRIPTSDIRPRLNMMRPVIWELSLKSEDKNLMKQSCHRFVAAATHDHIYAPPNYDSKLMLKGASYAYSTSILVEDTVQT